MDVADIEDSKRGDTIVSTKAFLSLAGWDGDPVEHSTRIFLSLERFTFDSIVTDYRGQHHHSRQVQFTAPDGYRGRASILYFLPLSTVERIMERFWDESTIKDCEEPVLTSDGIKSAGTTALLAVLGLVSIAAVVVGLACR